MKANSCMSRNNEAMSQCVDGKAKEVARRVQMGLIDQWIICRYVHFSLLWHFCEKHQAARQQLEW